MGEHSLSVKVGASLFLLLGGMVAGCGGSGDPQQVTGPSGGPARSLPVQARPEPAPSVYGPDGQLLPSEQVVAGLTLPRGFEIEKEEDRVTVLRGRVPVETALRYFGPLLMTGQVERIGTGARYVDAVPVGVRGGVVRLDVSVLPRSSGGTRVEVRERMPAAEESASEPGQPRDRPAQIY